MPPGMSDDRRQTPDPQRLKDLLEQADDAFWPQLTAACRHSDSFLELLQLDKLSRLGQRSHPSPPSLPGARVALVGGCTFSPLDRLLRTRLLGHGLRAELVLGDFDNHVRELLDPGSAIYGADPEIIVLVPSRRLGHFPGSLAADPEQVRSAALETVSQLVALAGAVADHSAATLLVSNWPLPWERDPGAFRSRSPASDWSYRKLLNQELGLRLPAAARIVDAEFISARMGTAAADDPQGWLESRQPGSIGLQVELATEIARLIARGRSASKKVLALDLDNTLWGGIIGDDGLDGIELGDTTARGEAFKDFQRYVKSLKDRGVLLAVCSKNSDEIAREPFERHPEMVLELDDVVAFQANWEPKPVNLRRIAEQLNLGIDSIVFVDDNPAEIEIVRQMAPEVTAVLLPEDPGRLVATLRERDDFEPAVLTSEDAARTEQYRQEARRRQLEAATPDLDAYLESLQMVIEIHPFRDLDLPRITQLINKVNQFNLTTVRRTAAEVRQIADSSDHVALTSRLSDKFGDHGLTSVVILEIDGAGARVDTWLMSCRVLQRQVEDEMLNEMISRLRRRGVTRLAGEYRPTAKNALVADLFPGLGFQTSEQTPERSTYDLEIAPYIPRTTRISRP